MTRRRSRAGRDDTVPSRAGWLALAAWLVLAAWICLSLAGCAPPLPGERSSAAALPASLASATALGRGVAPPAAERPDLSGIHPLAGPRESERLL